MLMTSAIAVVEPLPLRVVEDCFEVSVTVWVWAHGESFNSLITSFSDHSVYGFLFHCAVMVRGASASRAAPMITRHNDFISSSSCSAFNTPACPDTSFP